MKINTRIIYYLFFILVVTFSNSASSEESNSKHQIDMWLEQNISKDSSTVGMRNVTNQAREMWDSEMNKVYNRLMERLLPEQQTALRESQRAWLEFRNGENKAISAIIASKEGTMWQLIATNEGMQLVRARVLRLLAYEQYLEE